MSAYDAIETVDPAQHHVAALQVWYNLNRERARIEQELAVSYEALINRYREKCAECDREKRNAMLWEKEQRMAERELNGLKAAAESSPFAFVVIDGDGAIFREDLIARGEEGGSQAAHELHQQLKAYFHENPHFSSIDTIFVHVVLSVDGLSRALHASGTLPITDHAILTKFGRGFCRAQPLFSFTDVGYGKEQADHKVRKLFEVMEKNIQCRCLILAGCHDNGYATFLESFRSNQKICLLETTPPAADFRKLSFKRVFFPSVFRSEPLPARSIAPPQYAPAPTAAPRYPGSAGSPPPGFNGELGIASLPSPAPTASPKQAPPASLVASKPDGQPSSYAAVGRSSAPITINIASQKKPAASRPYYQLNKDDERVDVPLPKPDPNAVKSLEDRMHANGKNFCNRYYLMNSCKSANCSFYHGDRLSPAELLVLRHKTRNLPCGAGRSCREISCNLGHHCANPGSCYFGNNCRFADMHGMDIKPTIKIYEDGTREIL
ncbi:uncharacterized protein THITE_2119073 [Thermothielavioides terrestris NRRL 8126]|uniref:C3H1-type domain-containing protein n=1 Tax=Thermothielavioides terrestris (strain ATCC 38088 / NRRL 8126) TaxID=578455 RepID=G2RB98_THETT|nr:uncharacterized protein THITE_2119073 [Thermothielavioides terrestris NRRL 8126]AEO69069.1 hypothetical protein THITE_2119073 [Thermothielavioides terrestris NRRL 8126]